MSCNLRKSLLKCSDKILAVRENMGAQLADVYLIERTWSGQRQGDGSLVDVSIKISPIPEIVDYSHSVAVSESGAYKSGDILLRGISFNSYTESDLTTITNKKNVERFYKVGKHYYTMIHIKEKFLTWDIQLRKINQDETERG